MAVLRQDPTTEDWVVFAPERAHRPHEVAPGSRRRTRAANVHRKEDCPFCPGNEARTPTELGRWRLPGQAAGAWAVRAVDNRYPVFSPEGNDEVPSDDGPFRFRRALGAHEVVIDTPDHAKPLRRFDDEEMALLFRAYQARYQALRDGAGVRAVLPFRNHAADAGASLSHPHSQVIATPVLPPALARRLDVARAYRARHGRCRYCDLRDAERAAGERVLFESAHSVAFVPFAARAPYETWIVPRRHGASFADADDEAIEDAVVSTRTVLQALHAVAGDVPYNYIVRSALFEHGAAMLWHVEIVPRLTEAAGFELGSGMAVNPLLPERAAAALRERLPPDARNAPTEAGPST